MWIYRPQSAPKKSTKWANGERGESSTTKANGRESRERWKCAFLWLSVRALVPFRWASRFQSSAFFLALAIRRCCLWFATPVIIHIHQFLFIRLLMIFFFSLSPSSPFLSPVRLLYVQRNSGLFKVRNAPGAPQTLSIFSTCNAEPRENVLLSLFLFSSFLRFAVTFDLRMALKTQQG